VQPTRTLGLHQNPAATFSLRREFGKPMQKITAKKRNAAARTAVNEAYDLLGIEGGI